MVSKSKNRQSVSTIVLFLALFALLLSSNGFAQSGGSFSINQSVVANGGGLSSSPVFAIEDTSGQSAAGVLMTNSPYTQRGGFWTNLFTPTAADGAISGQVVDVSGRPLAGVIVNLLGTQNRLTVTDVQGNYRFDHVETRGFYVVTPWLANFTFTPAQRGFSQLGSETVASFMAAPTNNLVSPPER